MNLGQCDLKGDLRIKNGKQSTFGGRTFKGVGGTAALKGWGTVKAGEGRKTERKPADCLPNFFLVNSFTLPFVLFEAAGGMQTKLEAMGTRAFLLF